MESTYHSELLPSLHIQRPVLQKLQTSRDIILVLDHVVPYIMF